MMRELDLDAMLREPIVRMMMERDGIASGDLRQMLQKVKSARALGMRGMSGPEGPGGFDQGLEQGVEQDPYGVEPTRMAG